jgi:ubiquinone/menaquinone biosynthesis C-methylase UbiE
MEAHSHSVPNHHAHHRGFHGAFGLVAGVSFLFRRGPVAELAADLTGIGPDDHLVDIGCGPGAAVRVAVGRGASATGVDPATVMLRLGSIVTRSRRASYLEGTAESLPMPDASATVAWSLSAVHHWRDVDQGLAEVRRVLEPGGRFLATERQIRDASAPGRAGHGWTMPQAEAFASLCESAGLVDAKASSHSAGNSSILAVTAISLAPRGT